MEHDRLPTPSFCGQVLSAEQLTLIRQVTERYANLSRTEIAATACEWLEWTRPSGAPKTVECRQFLERLEDKGLIRLPARRPGRPRGSTTAVAAVLEAPSPIEGGLRTLQPVQLERVASAEARSLWRALVERHHYLGHKVAFGAHLRYLIRAEAGVLGCLQFSSPAWRIAARDRWIGWDEGQRRSRLQHLVCNSRFLILPWVRVPHLASHLLARAARRLVADWRETYGVEPWLLETLTDPARFKGTCYRAANWIELGPTSGRGRDDRHHRRHGQAPKQLWLYPLRADARARLQGGV